MIEGSFNFDESARPQGPPLRSLSIFFPAYNDAPSLPPLIDRAFEVGSRCAPDLEVIVVDDGSRDSTPQVIEQLRARFGPRLRCVRHAENQGYGGALRSGFRAAEGEFVFYTDGDGQYDVSGLLDLVKRIKPGVGLVNGYKTSRSDAWYRVWAGKLYLLCVRRVFRLKLRDVDCDFRLVRRSVLAGIEFNYNSGAICVELVRKIQQTGCDIAEVPVRHLPRLHGSSQFFRLGRICRTLVDLAALYWDLMIFRRYRPATGPQPSPESSQ